MAIGVLLLYNTFNADEPSAIVMITIVILLSFDDYYGSYRRSPKIVYDRQHFLLDITEMFILLFMMFLAAGESALVVLFFAFYALHGWVWDSYNIKKLPRGTLESVDLYSSLYYASGLIIVFYVFFLVLLSYGIYDLNIDVSIISLVAWAIWRGIFSYFQKARLEKFSAAKETAITIDKYV
jgi:hypothetical protein